jgi:hypothetical protein
MPTGSNQVNEPFELTAEGGRAKLEKGLIGDEGGKFIKSISIDV